MLQTHLIVFFILNISNMASPHCSQDQPRKPQYYLIEKCHRSTLSAIAKANFTSLSSCQRLGWEKRGLALNFSPPDVEKYMQSGDEPVTHTCEVLKCAESDGGVSLVNDTRYDYYSIYAKNIPHINSTCVPGIGMFRVQAKSNFSAASASCSNASGVLADVMTDTRTEALALVLAGSGHDAAYVGLTYDNTSDFVNNQGETLDCTVYRAWAPGHPRRRRHKFRCGVVTSSRTWQTRDCTAKLPALCELMPSGPYKRGAIFASNKTNLEP